MPVLFSGEHSSFMFFLLVWTIKTINLNRIVTKEIAGPGSLCILNKHPSTTFTVVHCKYMLLYLKAMEAFIYGYNAKV